MQKLIFIYNADSNLQAKLFDSVHKIISPSTYACNLCDITYGAFSENKVWKKFRRETPIGMEFLYKDAIKGAYAKQLSKSITYPIILIEKGDTLDIFIETGELNALNSAEGLIALIQQRLG